MSLSSSLDIPGSPSNFLSGVSDFTGTKIRAGDSLEILASVIIGSSKRVLFFSICLGINSAVSSFLVDSDFVAPSNNDLNPSEITANNCVLFVIKVFAYSDTTATSTIDPDGSSGRATDGTFPLATASMSSRVSWG